ncbi:anti-sigma factor antagonist [Bacillus sp. HMF5848]|uniref:STAS domain-containing protein n=1 Tax=Bacillus sp. HMF5848 TaxID=2495421 RepID=UPI000F7B5FAE|nr:STAS domain-containing protein [Bacillus sp. HMF5848]RSK27527.1 anti-sigma factor antagonist [Bacillus sp. HMF5848]
MRISSEIQDNSVYIMLDGKMYVQESNAVRDEVYNYVEQGYVMFVFDMKKLEYIDSSGLGVLVGLHKKITNENGKIILKGINGMVKDVIELTRLNLVFEIQA